MLISCALASGACRQDEPAGAGKDAASPPAADASPGGEPAAQPAVSEDAALGVRVQAKLAAAPLLADARIAVDARDGVVTLTGSVPTDEAKAAAERRAQRTRGVRSVVNRLTVGGG